MIAQEASEGIVGLVASQCCEETDAEHIIIPGVSDAGPWGAAVKTAILQMLEREGKIHRGPVGGFKIGPAPK